MDPILKFLEDIQATPREWKVAGNGLICTGPTCDCPLIYRAKEIVPSPWWGAWTNDLWVAAGGLVELLPVTSSAVAFAADDDQSADPWLRLALLACCGIKPIGGAT